MGSNPLHIQVRNQIKEGIERGLISPNAKGLLPGQQDLAKRYNVSLMTVKRAIRDLESIGLVESRRGKGLMLKSTILPPSNLPNEPNRVLHIGIAFFNAMRDINSPFVAKITRGIESAYSEQNIAIHTFSFPVIDGNSGYDSQYYNFPLMNLDGLLLLSPLSLRTITFIEEREIPYVSVNLLPDQESLCHMPDTISISYKLSDELLKRGKTNNILFVGSINSPSYHSFLIGHKLSYEKYGLKIDESYFYTEEYDLDHAAELLNEILDSGKPVDAVVAYDDIMAARLRDTLNMRGREDILVAGIGNFEPYANKVDITVEPRLEEMGRNIAETLLKAINGEKIEVRKVYYEPILIVKKS